MISRKKKKKKRKKFASFEQRQRWITNRRIRAIVFVKQTVNNLFLTIKDRKKKVLFVRSCGSLGLRGSKRGTFFAAVLLAKEMAKTLRLAAKRSVRVVLLSKLTKNTKLAVKNLGRAGLRILQIIERIPVPHNGMRGSKIRRL